MCGSHRRHLLRVLCDTSSVKADVLRVIEAAYGAGDDEQWLGGIAEAARVALQAERGVVTYRYFIGPTSKPEIGTFVERGASGFDKAGLEQLLERAPLELARTSFDRNRVATLSEFMGRPPRQTALFEQHLPTRDMQDGLGILTVDPSGEGLVITTGLSQMRELSPAFKRTWSRVMLHVSAGLRLRQARPGSVAAPEAVLDPDGKVQDASGPARDRHARAALRQAARAIDRARSSLEQDPESAVQLWRALVDARWSVIDWFDSDGRRFLIARPNPIGAQPVRRLTPAEQQVTALAALGRTNKLIAYELGVSVGTVGTLLSRAMHKLRLSSRAKLIEYWRRQAQTEPPAP